MTLEKITSIATSLGAKQVCEQAFAYVRQSRIISVVVSDQAALSACERFLADQRVLVEPACGAALAPVYERAPALSNFGKLLIIVCGGVAVPNYRVVAA